MRVRFTYLEQQSGRVLGTDPAAEEERLHEYECPRCGRRVEATGSVCCADCETEMQNLGKPRHW